MQPKPFKTTRLFCPGPTPVPMEAAIAGLDTQVYHRSPDFSKELSQCHTMLQPFMGTDRQPLILTSSGTGAMEAAVTNLTDVGDEVLIIDGGKFGNRWTKLCETYQCNTITLDVPWGSSPDLNLLEETLKKHPHIKAFFIQGNETSTGVAYPLREITTIVQKNSNALIVVDAISALVSHEIQMDKWGIDCLVSGSQKGFGIPPGLAFIALSQKATENLTNRPKFYFDLRKEAAAQHNAQTAWTPATSLIKGLRASLSLLNEIGVSECVAHHTNLAQACRKAVKALNFELLAADHPSNSLTSIKLPTSIDGVELLKMIKAKYGAIIAGGQDQLKGKIVRIAHLGVTDQFNLLTAISAFEFGLSDLGHIGKLGAGVSAAMEHLKD